MQDSGVIESEGVREEMIMLCDDYACCEKDIRLDRRERVRLARSSGRNERIWLGDAGGYE